MTTIQDGNKHWNNLMNITVGRGEKNLGVFTLGQISNGLETSLFSPSDYCWVEGMKNWLELPIFLECLKVLVPRVRRGERATPRQTRFLLRRSIPFPTDIRKHEAIRLIGSLPEPYRRLKAADIDRLKAEGLDLTQITFEGCVIRLARMR